MTPPTPEELLRLAREIAACAASWDPAVRLLGNVRASEVLSLANSVAGLLAERDFYRNEVMLYERAASFCPPKEDP